MINEINNQYEMKHSVATLWIINISIKPFALNNIQKSSANSEVSTLIKKSNRLLKVSTLLYLQEDDLPRCNYTED